MANIFVQFTDLTQTKICAVFSCAQDSTIYPNQGTISNTDARYLAFVNPLPRQAQSALAKADIVVIRCYSAGMSVPSAWNVYRDALRAIVNGTDTTSTTLPVTPPYPSGT